MIRTIHRAKYVLAESDLTLSDAAVGVSEQGRISRVETWTAPPRTTDVIDWGSVVLIPGFVNAHAHLELTRLGTLAPFASFTDWLRQLMTGRSRWTDEEYRASTRQGARLALETGTTLVGDVSASGLTQEALETEKLRKLVFEEIVGFRPERVPEVVASLETRLARIEADPLLGLGVSPHAPYSVSDQLFHAAVEIAARLDLPLAVHTAETRAELEFLEGGTGEFRDLLEELGVLPDGWRAPGVSPVVYLAQLGILDRPAVLIHGNYLDADSMKLIRRSDSSVVYCPRSHAFFGHEAHPTRQLLDIGVNVALGTDSLASNDSLSMLDEVRFLFDRRKDIKPEEIFRMATLNGAAALGFGGVLGRLRRGYWADFAVLEVPESASPRNLAAQILEGAGTCVATVVRGEIGWRRA
jgi:cytosine/adenosine deaminase-related metal-dependent hydrolase